KLGGYPERFCQSMQPIMNEDGLCYTYNNVDFKMEPESNEFDEPLVNIQGVGHKKALLS
ncbi:Sodium channel protein Nachlike, partial [Caligus rogercresseyi]